MILLLVTFGMLNICVGFGLAMYFGLGPPGLDGIFASMGPMPRAAPDPQSLVGLGAPYDPFAETSTGIAEERVLDDVRDLSDAAQASLAVSPTES